MKKITSGLLLLLFSCLQVFSQTSQTKSFSIPLKASVVLDGKNDAWSPRIQNHSLPAPDNGADEVLKQHVKNELMRNYRRKEISYRVNAVDTPAIMRNFVGNTINGSVPMDNDVAISDSGIICSVNNTTILSRNTVTNAIHGQYQLHTLSSTLGLPQDEFDPKIIYDPSANRFITIFLNGFTDSTSKVVVGFSQTDSSWGAWNFYVLPGNPLNDTSWTDFPMAAITGNELFLTVNLLWNDSTWQAGFRQTVIWQIKKDEGYTGASLNPALHSGIDYNGRSIRNLCPVKGGSQLYGPDMYFMSNRNFALSNDTFFLVHISDTINAPGQALTITPVLSDLNYHMPVNALQPFTDSLQINDARILGAFTENGIIQFVLSNFDTASGKDCIYLGIADSTSGWHINGYLYVHPQNDVAYPNISYAGSNSSDNRSIVTLLYSGTAANPGVGVIGFDGTNLFSAMRIVKSGTSYINVFAIPGTERRGDYTGNQRRYNQNGIVWVSGEFAVVGGTTRTWIAEINPDNITGVNENILSDENIFLFPNPAAERITVAFTNPQNQFLLFEIYDASGKLVKQLFRGTVITGENEFSFATSSLAAGSYLLRIYGNSDNYILAKQFVKN